MKDEFNKQVSENFRQPPELVEFPEAVSYKEAAPVPEEIKAYSDGPLSDDAAKAKTKKKSSKKSNIFTKISAIVAATAAVGIIAPTTIYASDDVTVDFTEVAVTDTAVTYDVNLENWSGDTYEIVLYNDFTQRSGTITSETYRLEEDNLKPGMTYTIAVKSGYTTIDSVSFRTKTEDELPVTALNEVKAECACTLDGTFQFTIDFVDENGWLSDFKATLTDSKGTVSECTFTSDPHGLQTIEVTSANLVGPDVTLRISCTSSNYIEGGVSCTLTEDGNYEWVIFDDSVEI